MIRMCLIRRWSTILCSSILAVLTGIIIGNVVPDAEGKPSPRGAEVLQAIQSRFIRDVTHQDRTVRYYALIALGKWYYRVPTAPRQPILDVIWHDRDRDARWLALLILADLPEDSGRHYPSRGITKALQTIAAEDPDDLFRSIAAVSLLKWGKLEECNTQIWDGTLYLLQSSDANLQDYALRALYHAGKHLNADRLHPSVKAHIGSMAHTPNMHLHQLAPVVRVYWGEELVTWLHGEENSHARQVAAHALRWPLDSREDTDNALLHSLRMDSEVSVRAVAAESLTGHPGRLHPRSFPQETQRKAWNTLIDTARNDGVSARASALLSLANLEQGDASIWQLFVEAMSDREEAVRVAAARGIGHARYISFNEAIEASLMHAAYYDPSPSARLAAVRSLSRFGYWDEVVHNFLLDTLDSSELRLEGIKTLGDCAKQMPQAARMLREAFSTTSGTVPQQLYIAMALVRAGVTNREYAELLVQKGLQDQDAELVHLCIRLLGDCHYSFVSDALLDRLRDRLGNAPSPEFKENLYPVTNGLGPPVGYSYCPVYMTDLQIRAYTESLMKLDGYSPELVAILPEVLYVAGSELMATVYSRYNDDSVGVVPR